MDLTVASKAHGVLSGTSNRYSSRSFEDARLGCIPSMADDAGNFTPCFRDNRARFEFCQRLQPYHDSGGASDCRFKNRASICVEELSKGR